MANEMLAELTKAAAQFMAIRAATSIGGGGLSGFLLSSVATKGIGKLFDRPKQEKAEGQQPAPAGKADTGPEDVGKRIGEAAAAAIEKILKDKLAPLSGPGHQQQQSGPLLPKPGDNQSGQDYINSLNQDQLSILRNGGKPTTAAANNVAQQAAAPAMARVTGTVAGPAAAGAGGAAAAGGAGAGGAAAGGAAAAGAVALPVVAVGVAAAALYELAKAGKEVAYAQEQYSRHLAEVNAVIGGQQAKLDFNRIIRDIESGDKLAGSNKELLNSIDRFEKVIRPIEDIANMLKNKIGTIALDQMATVIEQTFEISKKQYDCLVQLVFIASKGRVDLPWADDLLKQDGGAEGQGFGDFLRDVADREKEKRRHDEERLRNARGAIRGAVDW